MSSELDAHAPRSSGRQSLTSAGVATANYWLLLAVSLGLSCLDVLPGLNKNWFPWDEGMLGEMAERVLAGQLPHREYVDVYTGGLSFYDAGVFWLFGPDLLWLRVAMMPFFLAFIAATFYLATRLVSPIWAAVVAVAASTWTVPWYPAAMPSWYNLFLAVIGVAFMNRWLETQHRRWLWLAGFFGGLSILVKITGVYYVLAVVLYLAFRSRLRRTEWTGERRRSDLTGSLGVVLVALLCFGTVVGIVAPLLSLAVFIAFVVPAGAVALGVSVSELIGLRQGKSGFWRTLLVEIAPFVGGVLIPVVAFCIPYALSGGLGKLAYQVFVTPHGRLRFGVISPLPAEKIVLAAPLVLLFAVPWMPGRLRKLAAIVGGAVYSVAAFQPYQRYTDSLFIKPAREFLPVLAIAASVAIVLLARRRVNSTRFELFALLAFAMAFMALTQFPFGPTGYFLYMVPFVLLTAVAFVSTLNLTHYRLFGLVLVAYLITGAFTLNTGLRSTWLNARNPADKLAVIDPQRARIEIAASDAALFQQVVALLDQHAKNGMTIAAPDAPEIYYLANLRNPTPMIFDVLTPEPERDRVILDAVADNRITAIVVDQVPPYSPPLDARVLGRLDELYPNHQVIGDFDVRWRT